MTSYPAVNQTPTVSEPATRPRRHIGRGAAIAVIAAVLVVSGCSNGNDGLTDATDRVVSDAAATSSDAPADAGRATSAGRCDGTIGDDTVDEVRVPSGAICRLIGTTVTGNVSIAPGGTLLARRVAVDGDIEGQGARRVAVSGRSSIGGNLQLEQGGSSTVSGAEIDGDLQWTMQTGKLIVRRTFVSGDVQADQNRGGLVISANRIGGDLECLRNTPRPAHGGNAVGGHREGQCVLATGGQALAQRDISQPRTHSARPRPACAGDSVSDDRSDDSCRED